MDLIEWHAVQAIFAARPFCRDASCVRGAGVESGMIPRNGGLRSAPPMKRQFREETTSHWQLTGIGDSETAAP